MVARDPKNGDARFYTPGIYKNKVSLGEGGGGGGASNLEAGAAAQHVESVRVEDD